LDENDDKNIFPAPVFKMRRAVLLQQHPAHLPAQSGLFLLTQ
jgi:hypothetical protein